MTAGDADFMARALFHAARGRGRTSPNPVVGAVVVSSDGVVVGQGYHAEAGGPHAEICALDAAGERARGATLYCTLEPCNHTGRTGPCVPRIVDAGIARVVAAMEDPNPIVKGRGFTALSARGVRVDVGVASDLAALLNQPFTTRMREGRPFVILKAAISTDGCLARRHGERTALTSGPANRHAHRFRAEVDAIAVGVGTVRTDDPVLTPRGVFRALPLTRVIFDRQLRTPAHAAVLSTAAAGPVIILTTAAGAAREDVRRALERPGVEFLVTDGSVHSALRMLGTRGVSSLLVEGGAGLHTAVWDAGVVDYVRLYVSPHTFGAEGVRFLPSRRLSSMEWPERRVTPLGPDVLIEGYVHRPR